MSELEPSFGGSVPMYMGRYFEISVSFRLLHLRLMYFDEFINGNFESFRIPP